MDGPPDYNVLMNIPELYRYGREGTWFGLGTFFLYLLDGLYQVSVFCVFSVNAVTDGGLAQSVIIYFFIMFAYFSPTSRTDGYDTSLYEFSTVRG